jgi:hypothetical protein
MFKYVAIAVVCLTTVPVIHPHQAIAEPDSNSVDRRSDLIAQSTMRRSPESLERQRLRERLRRRQARRQQIEWRRRYGDLAPSRQRSEQ